MDQREERGERKMQMQIGKRWRFAEVKNGLS